MDELERKEENAEGQEAAASSEELQEPESVEEAGLEEDPAEAQPEAESEEECEESEAESETESASESESSQEAEEPAIPPEENTEENPEVTIEAVAEAVLFATDEALPLKRLAEIIGAGGVAELRKIIEGLNAK